MAAITAVEILTPVEDVDSIEGSAEVTGFVERLRTGGDIPWNPICTALASILGSVVVSVILLATPAFLMVAEISRVGATVDNIDADVEKKVLLLEQEIETMTIRINFLEGNRK